ncbi:MAG: hypothetical protein AAFV43_04570 [Planctomycetota bacterium]
MQPASPIHASGPTWRIGLDEAGYGPNLGPLTIGATAWRLDRDADLYDALSTAVAPVASDDDRLVIADSKVVYQPGGGLAGLEAAVLAAFGGNRPATFTELLATLGADPNEHRADAPWRAGFDTALPIDAGSDTLDEQSATLERTFQSAGVSAPRLAARVVYPAEFNDLVDRYGSKGAALSHATLELARRVLDDTGVAIEASDLPVRITFDKHGGRNRYGALVQHWLPEAPLTVIEESRPVSRYRVGASVELVFRSKGEAELPVALASMIAKLLRELTMLGFNRFWAQQVPGVRPTAGYPVDAKRFLAAIAARQAELGIDHRRLWRNR